MVEKGGFGKLEFMGSDWEELLERSSPQTPFKNFQKEIIYQHFL